MLRMSPEDFENLRNRIQASTTQMREPIHQHVPKTKNKYRNEVTMLQGHRFDSKSEARRFIQLQEMEKAGQISDLKIQVQFDLLPEQQIEGKKERAVRYFADFTYMKKGQLVIEDVKSAPTKTKEFIIKRKLMMFIHHAIVREILMS